MIAWHQRNWDWILAGGLLLLLLAAPVAPSLVVVARFLLTPGPESLRAKYDRIGDQWSRDEVAVLMVPLRPTWTKASQMGYWTDGSRHLWVWFDPKTDRVVAKKYWDGDGAELFEQRGIMLPAPLPAAPS